MTREIVSDSKQDWATPQWLFDVLHEEFKFQVDLMAAWYNTKLPTFYGPGSALGENVFAQSWGNIRGFANPPYRALEQCLSYALEQSFEGAETTWLVPANTDTGWFHEYAVKGRLEFFKGRISFEDHTPADVEACRLWVLYRKKPTPKTLKKLGEVVYELRQSPEALESLPEGLLSELAKQYPAWSRTVPSDRKKPGPGFPSMLVHFVPGIVGTQVNIRMRSAKTGKIIS